MKKFIILFVFVPILIIAQTDNAESYTGNNFTDENFGSNWTGNFQFKAFSTNDNGGEYIESSATNSRQISGNKSFALYANNSGTGTAVSRSFSSAKTGLTRIAFRIRFDLNTSDGQSAGVVLSSTFTNDKTSWNTGQRLYVGISGDGIWKYDNGTLHTIRNADNSADYTCEGGHIYLVTIDFDVRSSGTFGNDKFCMKIVNESNSNEASETLTNVSLGGTANASMKSIAFGNGVVGSSQNLIWDDIETTDNPSSPLPVELTSFSAKFANNAVLLNWSTATEVNNYGFEIERKSSSENWTSISFIPGAGTSNSPKDYIYSDNTVQQGVTYQYRLKQIDTDGSIEYSRTVEIFTGMLPQGFVLDQNYPNPFNPSTTIRFGFNDNTKATLKVYNTLGVEVAELFNGIADAGRIYEVEFNGAGLASGTYLYKLITPSGEEVKKMQLLK